jgi:hypothetical protein
MLDKVVPLSPYMIWYKIVLGFYEEVIRETGETSYIKAELKVFLRRVNYSLSPAGF